MLGISGACCSTRNLLQGFYRREARSCGKFSAKGLCSVPCCLENSSIPRTFNPSILLTGPRSRSSSSHNETDWIQTGHKYVLRSKLPGESSVQIYVDDGKIMKISGVWKKGQTQEWRCGRWWEHGFVRRLELPEDTDWKRAEAKLAEESNSLEISIPINCSPPNGND